jgi:hypothetical protein
MQVSRKWRGLFFFWVTLIVLCGVGAAALQILGPPSGQEQPVPQAVRAVAPPGAGPSNAVPSQAPAAPAPTAPAPGMPPSPQPSMAATTAAPAPPAASKLAPLPTVSVPERSTRNPTEDAPPAAPPQPDRRLTLHVVRDDQICGVADCAEWRVIKPDDDPGMPDTIDLSRFRLSPSLRNAESGRVELILEVLELHRTVAGKTTVQLIPTGLSGFIRHDSDR